MRRIVITGMGLVTPLGVGVETVWSRLLASRSGFRRLPDEIVGDLPAKVGGAIPRLDEDELGGLDLDRVVASKDQRRMDRFIVLRYVTPFDPDSRFAPMPAADIARIVVGILENPGPHIGQAYQLHGPVEYSHAELAKVVGQVLGKPIVFEQMEMLEFIKLLGLENDKMKKHHIQSVRIDQQEGLLRGTDDIGTRIIGRPLMTIEEFINENRLLLS